MKARWVVGVACLAWAGCGDDGGSTGAGGDAASSSSTATTGPGGAGASGQGGAGGGAAQGGAGQGGGAPQGGGGDGGSGGAPALVLGATCDEGAQCESGQCADGVCCESACDGTCEACAAAVHGGQDGQCEPVPTNTDPDDECEEVEGGCFTGACNGVRACQFRDQGTVCRAADDICDAAEVCPGTEGICPADAFLDDTVTCGNYVCGGASSACPASCTSDDDCATDAFCTMGGACVSGRRAFISSSTTTGNIGGIAGGDALCQGLADARGFAGTYKAWLSDANSSVATRFTQSSVPYRLVDGTVLADDWADLIDGSIDVFFRLDDLGNQVASNVPFTGTNSAGAYYDGMSGNCSQWMSNASNLGAWSGWSENTGYAWSSNYVSPCNTQHRLYCFQQ